MATSRTSYGKLQRDRAKKERQQLKRERRFDRSTPDPDEEEVEEVQVSTASTEDILERVAELHRRFDDEEIDFDDFEEQKAALMAQLTVD